MFREVAQTAEALEMSRHRAWGRSLLEVARRKPLGTAGAVVTLVLIFSAIFAPLIAPFDPYDFNLTEGGLPIRQQAPNGEFLFGTDTLGRDVFSRIIYGSRVSLMVGFLSVALGVTVGTAIGLASGYWGGKVDQILQRINLVLENSFRIRHTTLQFEHVRCEHAESICSNRPAEEIEHQH